VILHFDCRWVMYSGSGAIIGRAVLKVVKAVVMF